MTRRARSRPSSPACSHAVPDGSSRLGGAGRPGDSAHSGSHALQQLRPRLGLAYSPGFTDGVLGKIFGGPGKTSIRASFGIYYTSIEDLNLFYEVGDAPFGLYWDQSHRRPV